MDNDDGDMQKDKLENLKESISSDIEPIILEAGPSLQEKGTLSTNSDKSLPFKKALVENQDVNTKSKKIEVKRTYELRS